MACAIWLRRDFLLRRGLTPDEPPCEHDRQDCPPPRTHRRRTSVTQYRKRPVVIEAVQFKTTDYHDFKVNGRLNFSDTPEWLAAALDYGTVRGVFKGEDYAYLEIKTLEGVMLASPGDWIICGVAQEIYPCKPDIFAETYEAVA